MSIFDFFRGENKQQSVQQDPHGGAMRMGVLQVDFGDSDAKSPDTHAYLNAVKNRAMVADSACNTPSDPYNSGQPNISDALAMWFASQGFIGHQLAAMVAQHWLVLKACAMPSRDAVRNGWKFTGEDDAAAERAELFDRHTGTKQVLQEFITKGRIFGIRIAIPQVEYADPDEAYSLPFNLDGVPPDSFKGWVQIDPYWCVPQQPGTQADKPGFYVPEYWVVNGRKYHRSHLIIYRHGELADILKPAYLYGGIPLPQQIMERVYGAERTANEAPLLTLTKRTIVYKTDLSQAAANFNKLREKAQQMVTFWSNYGMRVIDKEADDHTQLDTGLADLDSVIMTQYQLVAAVAEVPATKLLGTSPKGFNATGEHETSTYYQMLESLQQNDMAPFLQRHYELLEKSWGLERGALVYEFNPVASPSYMDRANAKAVLRQAGAALVQAGVIDATQEAQRIANEDGGDYAGIL